MYIRTHNVRGTAKTVSERCLEELHGEVHLIVNWETLHDAQHSCARWEDAERRAPAEPASHFTFSSHMMPHRSRLLEVRTQLVYMIHFIDTEVRVTHALWVMKYSRVREVAGEEQCEGQRCVAHCSHHRPQPLATRQVELPSTPSLML